LEKKNCWPVAGFGLQCTAAIRDEKDKKYGDHGLHEGIIVDVINENENPKSSQF